MPGKRLFLRALGRFQASRQLFGGVRGLSRPPRAEDTSRSLFPGSELDGISRDLKRDGLYVNFPLPQRELQEIRDFVATAPCTGGFGNPELARLRFAYAEHKEIERSTGVKLIIAHYPEPHASCPAIRRLIDDPVVRTLAARYLGAQPEEPVVLMWWSFVTDVPPQERLHNNQTIRFHYDEFAVRFLYFSFYITPVGEDAGPHDCIVKSHRRKSLRQKLGPATRPDEEILASYPPESIVRITGPAGTGFIEDASCFHRATVPTGSDRLMLQVRFGLGRRT